MRIAIQNPFFNPWVAEAALCHRIQWAASQIGWQAIPAHTAADIEAIAPDFVLALHNNDPKLAGYPTYGCMWNPPSMFEATDPHVANILSYDAYLISSAPIEQWLHRLLCRTPKPFLTAPFHTSCPQTVYQPPRLDPPRLFYCGSNWDGPRFKTLFELLDRQPYLDIYGHPEGWTYLNQSFRGPFPYDWVSVPDLIRQSGVGLCLHRQQHHDAAVPSLRIFEITAAGAIAICGDHPFIREAFGDTVLYMDPLAAPQEQFQQIDAHMTWIAAHPDAAREMTRQAHQIFVQHFALEHLLQNLLPLHEAVLQTQGFVSPPVHCPPPSSLPLSPHPTPRTQAAPRVYYFLRTHQDCLDLDSRLTSLARQSYPNRVAVLLPEGDAQELEQQVGAWQAAQQAEICSCSDPNHRLAIHICKAAPPDSAHSYHSTALWQALQSFAQGAFAGGKLTPAPTDYFGILDHAVLHPNHVQRLVALLTHSPVALAYSGGVPLSSQSPTPPPALPHTSLLGFQPFHLLDFWQQQQTLIPDAFLIRVGSLAQLPSLDPQLNQSDVLCLLMCLCQQQPPLFSYEATCAVEPDRLEHYQHLDPQELIALRFVFWHQELAPGLALQPWGYPVRLNAAVQPLPELEQQLHQLEPQVHHLEQQLQQLHQLKPQVHHLEQQLHQLNPQVHHLKQQQQTYQTVLDQYQHRLEALLKEQHRLQGSLTRQIEQSMTQATQLRDAHNTIEAMESSKFWKLRKAWFRAKRLFGVKVE